MSDTKAICAAVVLTISSVAWAMAYSSSRKSPDPYEVLRSCAFGERVASQFCIELAKAFARPTNTPEK